MQIKKFKVNNLSDGLERIKAELGADAVILSTSKLVGEPGGETLEITVAVEARSAARGARSSQEIAPVKAEPRRSKAADAALTDVLSAMLEQMQSLRAEVAELRANQKDAMEREHPRTAVERTRALSTGEHGAFQRTRSALRMGLAMSRVDDATPDFAANVSLLYQGLLSNGVLAQHAETIIGEAFAGFERSDRAAGTLFKLVEDEIESHVATGAPLWHDRTSKTQMSVFVGPTGVGKTRSSVSATSASSAPTTTASAASIRSRATRASSECRWWPSPRSVSWATP